MDNDEYDETEAAPWYGWTWINADGYQYEQMCEALTGHLDDESDADAAMAYVAKFADMVLDNDTEYTPAEIAAMYTARKQEREYEDWATIGIEYMNDHYLGLWTDGMINLPVEEADDIGRRVAAADSTQYWWHETTGGTIVCLLTPAYAEEAASAV